MCPTTIVKLLVHLERALAEEFTLVAFLPGTLLSDWALTLQNEDDPSGRRSALSRAGIWLVNPQILYFVRDGLPGGPGGARVHSSDVQQVLVLFGSKGTSRAGGSTSRFDFDTRTERSEDKYLQTHPVR